MRPEQEEQAGHLQYQATISSSNQDTYQLAPPSTLSTGKSRYRMRRSCYPKSSNIIITMDQNVKLPVLGVTLKDILF